MIAHKKIQRLLGVLLVALSAQAQGSTQFSLGDAEIVKKERFATITLPECKKATQVRLKVFDDMGINRVRLVDDAGKKRVIRYDRKIKGGKVTKWVTLGAERCIKAVRIYAKSNFVDGYSHGKIRVYARNKALQPANN
ncbi:MAG: hypothetical protein ACRCYV_07035 [Aeromonas sp.]